MYTIPHANFTEIAADRGKFLTQSSPTYFPQFWSKKILLEGDSIDNYKDVTSAEKTKLEQNAAEWTRPPQAFIDLWNNACESEKYGKYNEETGYFELNGLLDLTYNQAKLIYTEGKDNSKSEARYRGLNIRTTFPIHLYNVSNTPVLGGMFQDCYYLERVCIIEDLANAFGVLSYMFAQNRSLVSIDTLHIGRITGTTEAFSNCVKLETLKLKFSVPLNGTSIQLTNSPKLSYDSLDFIVTYSVTHSENGLTFVLHKDVYDKITGTTILPEEEALKWQALATRALEKNIFFVSA